MEGFVGRSRELANLNAIYGRPGLQTCAVYGRRRVGKTTLLKEFCKDKDALFFVAVEDTDASNAKQFDAALSFYSGMDFSGSVTMMESLDKIKSIAGKGRLVIVIDEYPYLADSAGYVSSVLQRLIDNDLSECDMMIILCGSSISAMRDEIDGSKKPLFGRFLNRMEILPLPFTECRKFHPKMSNIDNLALYMAVGGIPLYHKMLEGETFEECIKNAFLGTYSPLRNEVSGMIMRELSPNDVHSSILSAMAGGATRKKEISEKCGISLQLCTKYMDNMQFLGMIELVEPMGNSPKRGVYRIRDYLLDFHHTVIKPNAAFIEGTDPDISFQRIEQIISTYMGKAFEKVCLEYVLSAFPCRSAGRWWGRAEDEDVDIDIVAVVTDDNSDITLFGECKYSSKKIGFGTADTLIRRSGYVKGLQNPRYVIFSKAGFEEGLEDRVPGTMHLVTVDDMFSGKKPQLFRDSTFL